MFFRQQCWQLVHNLCVLVECIFLYDKLCSSRNVKYFAVISPWLSVFFSRKKSYRFSSPIPMDQFAWTREQAVSRMGIIMSVGGVILILLYLMMNTFTKYVGERKLLIFCGIIPTIIGQSLFSPMTSEKPQMFGNFTIGGIC